MKVTMIGTGYVGLVSGTCLAEVGHFVTCVDLDKEKIRLLRDGVSPIFEPGLSTYIKRNVEHDRLTFTTELSEALEGSEVAFIAVGTPEGEDGSCDLNYVRAAARSIGQLMKQDLLIIVKSTVPVGTCEIVEQVLTEENNKKSQPVKFEVASNPEFLKEGEAIKDFMKPDRIVAGVTSDWSEAILEKLYKPFVTVDPSRLLIMDRKSSELTKYASNSMLATRISFMNELSELCEKVDANIDNIRRGMGMDPRIGKSFLYAGPGYGGSCFPKDVVALLRTCEQRGVDFSVLASVRNANQKQKTRVAQKIVDHLGSVKGKKIAVWGLAFKPGTDDVRETPAQVIIDTLLKAGATIAAHDPEAMPTYKRSYDTEGRIEYVEKSYDALKEAAALVLVTEWSEYKQPNWTKVKSLLKGKAIFDFRNQYSREDLLALGLEHIAVGK